MSVINVIIDYSTNYNLQNKKYDYVKIAFIMSHFDDPITANTVNFYFNKIFPQNYVNTARIARIIRSKASLFGSIGVQEGKTRQTKLYYFNGSLKLNKTTQINWRNKAKNFF